MIIAQISDTHISLDAENAQQRIVDFERTIADINRLVPAVDLIIHTGDIVQNGRVDEYERAADILSRADAPVYLMVGNKDDRNVMRDVFKKHTYLNSPSPFIQYTLDDHALKLVILDTLNPGSNKGDFCRQRTQELEALLAENTGEPVAVFMHHPPFHVLEGPESLHFETEEIMQGFCEKLQNYPSVIGIFSGHVHRGVAGQVKGIPVLSMPSIATSLRWSTVPQVMKNCPVYHLVQYGADKVLTTQTRIVDMDAD